MAILASIFLASGAACIIYSFSPSSCTKKKWEAFLRFLWNFQSSLLGKGKEDTLNYKIIDYFILN